MEKWDVKFFGDYLVQVYDLGGLYLTYNENGDIIYIDKDHCSIIETVIANKSIEDATLLDQVVVRLSNRCGLENNEVYIILQQLVKCSKGVTKFLAVSSGTKLSKNECKNLRLKSARILGCSVMGIGSDDKNELVIMRKGREERLGNMNNITKERFIELYNMLDLAYREVLGVRDMQSLIGILIETLCAEADIKGKMKFINHSNYFDVIDTNVDWIYELESGYKKLDSLSEPAKCLLKYVKIVLYDKDLDGYIKESETLNRPINRYGNKGVVSEVVENSDTLDEVKGKCSLTYSAPGYSHLNQNNEAFKARIAWFEENYGENWREIIKIANPTENQFTELKEHLNIVLSTIVFDATKLIHSGLRPKCKENTMKSLYSEIFKPVLVTVLTTRLSEETRTVITEELAKYFEVIPKDVPQYMNIFPNQGLAPDGGKYR